MCLVCLLVVVFGLWLRCCARVCGVVVLCVMCVVAGVVVVCGVVWCGACVVSCCVVS